VEPRQALSLAGASRTVPRIISGDTMRRLVVHIGLQKTGSSSIQRMLTKETKRLAAQSVYVASTGRPKAGTGNHNIALEIAGNPRFNPAHGTLAGLKEEIAASEADTVIVSSEMFDSVPREKVVYRKLVRLAHSLSRELVVVGFVRDHVSALNSRYTQLVKTFHNARPFETYVASQLKHPYWSYWRLFIGYERVADRTMVLPHDGDVLATFCSRLGLDIDAARHKRRNLSVGPKTIEACRILVRHKGLPGAPFERGGLALRPYLETLGVRTIAARQGWDATPYWGFTPELARQTWRTLMPPDKVFFERYGIPLDRSRLDRPRNDIVLDDMDAAERAAFMSVLQELKPVARPAAKIAGS
jgi:hypothetical protein